MSWRECNLELLKQINIGRVHHPPMSNNMAPFALCTPLPPPIPQSGRHMCMIIPYNGIHYQTRKYDADRHDIEICFE